MIFIIAGLIFGITVGVKEKIGGGFTVALTILSTFLGILCSMIIGGYNWSKFTFRKAVY